MFAVKRQLFKNKCHLKEFNMMANKYEIEQFIIQLAIYKICSFFKIGPAVQTDIGFDLICYRDCIEFQIELCHIIECEQGIYADQTKFQKQMKQNLLILHFFKIIHKDIKPANMLFSIKYNKYVLSDFGISHPIFEQIGQPSKTYRQGTFEYMSQQMAKLQIGQIGCVHLYGNDVYALSIVLKKKKINQNLKLFNVKSPVKIYQYEYFKLKYFCIKPDHHINNSSFYWKCMDKKRKDELISIVSKSTDFVKISAVYNQLSKLKQFKGYDLQNLKRQAVSIKQINLYMETQQQKYNSQIYLKNNLRAYGYNQKIKNIIQKLKVESKYPKTIQEINKINQKQYFPNSRDLLFDTDNFYRRFIIKHARKFNKQIIQYYKSYSEIFKIYIYLLKVCWDQFQVEIIIENLQNLKYQRQKKQQIEEKIMTNFRKKNKQQLQKFVQEMKIKDPYRDSVIEQLRLSIYVGQIYYYLEKYQIALQYNFRAQTHEIKLYGQFSFYLVLIYNNIASAYFQLSNYKQALRYLHICLKISIQLFGQDHIDVAQNYINIADIYSAQRNYETSLSYYFKSANIFRKYYGQQQIYFIYIYQNIGIIYQRLCKYQQSLQYCKKNLKICILFYGQTDIRLVNTYKNLSSIYIRIDNYDKALEYLTKTLNILIKYYGEQHNSIAQVYKNFGIIHKVMGEHEIALNYFTKSLKINIQYFGYKHITVAQNYVSLAIYYLDIGKYQQALKILKKNLLTQMQLEGQKGIHIAVTYYCIGNAYKNKGEYQSAFDYFERSLNIYMEYYDSQHLNIAVINNQIGFIYYMLRRYDEALANYFKSLQIDKKFNNPEIANTWYNIAQVYFDKGDYQKAIDYYKKSVHLNIKNCIQKQKIAETYANIGMCKLTIGQVQKAHLYTYKSLKIKKTYLPIHHPKFEQNYCLLFDIFRLKNDIKKSTVYLNMMIQIFLKYKSVSYSQYYDYLYSLGKILYKTKKYRELYFIFNLCLNFDQDKIQNKKQIKKIKKKIYLIQKMDQLYLSLYQLNHESLIILNQKYIKLSKFQLLKILQVKKLLLKMQQQYSGYTISSMNKVQSQFIVYLHIQYKIQIWLCYKYLKLKSETQKTLMQLKSYLQQLAFPQLRQELYRYIKLVDCNI